jgi:XTP/dITP diphosphohydrolase
MSQLLLGTRNAGKIAELRRLLLDVEGLELLTSSERPFAEVVETGKTFLENALLKAREIVSQTNLPVLAEDAGLEVAALGGAPGVYSARFAGLPVDYAANNRLLLERLEGVDDRRARFLTVAVLLLPDGREFVTTGTLAGTIGERPIGEGGFGYDPLFVPEGESRTLAELSLDEKNRISHRMRAMRRMLPILRELLGRSS